MSKTKAQMVIEKQMDAEIIAAQREDLAKLRQNLATTFPKLRAELLEATEAADRMQDAVDDAKKAHAAAVCIITGKREELAVMAADLKSALLTLASVTEELDHVCEVAATREEQRDVAREQLGRKESYAKAIEGHLGTAQSDRDAAEAKLQALTSMIATF